MVGLDKFREAFADYKDNYVIIGGTACDIVMSGTVVRPRATHDIDMIVVVENMTPDFGRRFWDFIKEAGYKPERRKAEEVEPPKYELYRFVDGKEGYPEMIELLSRHPEVLGEPKDLVIEPLPVSEDISSLSAIILDENYYYFTIAHSVLTDGIRHADPIALIALKTKAYLNLLEEKQKGGHVNTRNIKKHRSDVLKNAVLVEESPVKAPQAIVECVRDFVAEIRSDSENLVETLAKAIDSEPELVEQLLGQLDNLFIAEQ
jgi:predicted nucleotidyltransferase